MSARTVFIVDDDFDVRGVLEDMLVGAGFEVLGFGSGQEFLDEDFAVAEGVLLLDQVLPGLAGEELLAAVRERYPEVPIIVVTAFGDVERAVGAMKGGAFDFVTKPVIERRLISAVEAAFDRAEKISERGTRRIASRIRMRSLSAREHQVAELVVAGLQTKDIAQNLGISPYTVESHRTRLMAKMQTPTLADLVRRVCEAVL